jgi:hypothetical protein
MRLWRAAIAVALVLGLIASVGVPSAGNGRTAEGADELTIGAVLDWTQLALSAGRVKPWRAG